MTIKGKEWTTEWCKADQTSCIKLPVDGERLPCLLLFGHADDAGWRPAGTPHAAAPPTSDATSPLHPNASHPTRLPRRTPHLLVVVQHAAGAHRQDTPAERRRHTQQGEIKDGGGGSVCRNRKKNSWFWKGDIEVRCYVSDWTFRLKKHRRLR